MRERKGRKSETSKGEKGGEARDEKTVKAAGAGKTKRGLRVWLLAILRMMALTVLTGAVIIAAQLFVGNILIAIIGRLELSNPMWSAIYSALSYIVTILVLILMPNLLAKVFTKKGPTKKKVSSEKKGAEKADLAGTAEKSVVKNTTVSPSLREKLGLSGWPTWTDIGLAPIGYAVYFVLAAGLTVAFMQLFPWFNSGEVQEVGFSYSIAGGERVIAFITLAVVAPIAEEMIFRGWFYEEIRSEFRGRAPKWVGILIPTILTSVLFGVMHLQWNVGVNVFALSVVMCLMREITGTTYAGILLHMLKNGIAFYLLFIIGA